MPFRLLFFLRIKVANGVFSVCNLVFALSKKCLLSMVFRSGNIPRKNATRFPSIAM